MNVATAMDSGIRSLPAEFAVEHGRGFGQRRLWHNQAGMHGLGLTAAEIADMISQTNAAMLPLIVAQNPGVMYTTNPQTGQITVYAQPTGNTQNLAVGAGGGGYGYPGATVTTPIGSASATFGGGTMLMIAAVGLLAIMMLKR